MYAMTGGGERKVNTEEGEEGFQEVVIPTLV
jgi:hypothetical protein